MKVNDDIFVLLRVNSLENDVYNLNDIIEFNNKIIVSKHMHVSWSNLWMKRVDDLESELSEYNKEYPIVRETFDYFSYEFISKTSELTGNYCEILGLHKNLLNYGNIFIIIIFQK